MVCLWNIVRLGVCGTILNNQCSTVYTFCSISIFFLGLQDLPVGIWNVAASLCGNCCDFSFCMGHTTWVSYMQWTDKRKQGKQTKKLTDKNMKVHRLDLHTFWSSINQKNVDDSTYSSMHNKTTVKSTISFCIQCKSHKANVDSVWTVREQV